MSAVARTFKMVDDVLHGINDWFAQPAYHYCRLETCADDTTLVADDGSLISVIECRGNLKMTGPEEHEQMINTFVSTLSSRFSGIGHAIQVVMSYNPAGAKEEIKNAFLPSKITARNLGLNVDSIMDDWSKSVARYCAVEHIYIVAWTRPSCLPSSEMKKARKKMGRKIVSQPNSREIQNLGMGMNEIMDHHSSFVSQIENAMRYGGMVHNVHDVHKALWIVRREIDMAFTSRKWRPVLPGDKVPLNMPKRGTKPEDVSEFFYPSIGKQVFPREAEVIDRKTIRIGDHIHSAVSMTLPPQTPQPFNMLFRALKAKNLPWRASFLFDGNGLASTNFKQIMSSILYFSSSTNKKLNKALEELRARELEGETLVRFSASFDTWVKDDKTEHCLQVLQKRTAELVGSVQGWGTCDCGEITGDPLLGVSATVPCLMPTSPAPTSVAPIYDVVHMLPFTRPASPWQTGSIMLRTPDGKIWPYTQGSSKQAAWIDIGFAPMGSGKSVWLNTMNWGFITQPGSARLPWLSIIDIGLSSSGLIDLIRSMLPKDKKYLAAYHRLRMSKEYAINPFDTPLGCRKPFPSQITFLTNLMCLVGTPLNEKAPPDGISDIAGAVIKYAYNEFSDDKNPKRYVSGKDPIVDKYLAGIGYHIKPETAWWDVVDALFEKGYTHEALRAQRYAVPLLSDIAGMVKRPQITRMFKHSTGFNESITEFFHRSCTSVISRYEILKDPTRFDIGDAQIVSLDLDQVAPRGGPEPDRITGIMYMLARHVVASKFFMMPRDIDYVPDLYKEYHTTRIMEIRQDPKRLCYDELHRVARNSAVSTQLVGDLETSARESRKWNLHIGLYSQSIDDFPDILLELATAVFILGSGTAGNVEKMVKRLGLNDTAHHAISNLRKPGKEGAAMVAYFRTGYGNSVQLLTNTIGMQALWAFSSTSEDIQIRTRLYQKIGVTKTLKILSEKYPGGIKPEVELRNSMIDEYSEMEENVDVIDEIYKEIISGLGSIKQNPRAF
jgi:intracellular multiplication protein IcmB